MTAPVILTGHRGILGSALHTALRDAGYAVHGFARPEHDITHLDEMLPAWTALQPRWVLNCAAYTRVDAAESHPEEAWAANAVAPGAIAAWCRAQGVRLLHVSTDYVFDGMASRPYREDAPRNPRSAYGASKAGGELAVEASGAEWLIVRTAWLYGAGGRNFVETILAKSRELPALRVVNDQRGSPTWSADLAGAIVRLLAIDARGLVHVTNAGDCTWHEFAVDILRRAGIATPVTPITTAEYPVPARRPAYSVLDGARYASLTGATPRHWRDALAAYLRDRRPTASSESA